MAAIADRVRAIRERAGLGVPAAARLCGVPEKTFYNWESGVREPMADGLARLCRGLGVSADDLLFGPADAPCPCRPKVREHWQEPGDAVFLDLPAGRRVRVCVRRVVGGKALVSLRLPAGVRLVMSD